MQHFWFSLTKNGCLAVLLGAQQYKTHRFGKKNFVQSRAVVGVGVECLTKALSSWVRFQVSHGRFFSLISFQKTLSSILGFSISHSLFHYPLRLPLNNDSPLLLLLFLFESTGWTNLSPGPILLYVCSIDPNTYTKLCVLQKLQARVGFNAP